MENYLLKRISFIAEGDYIVLYSLLKEENLKVNRELRSTVLISLIHENPIRKIIIDNSKEIKKVISKEEAIHLLTFNQLEQSEDLIEQMDTLILQ